MLDLGLAYSIHFLHIHPYVQLYSKHMKSIGVDIGAHSIKICIVEQNSKGLFLQDFIQKNLSNSPQVDRDLEVIEFLRNTLSPLQSAKTHISVGIKQDKISTVFKTFPFKDKAKILKSLPFELEEDIPLSPDDAVFDGRMIQFIGNTTEVLACAASKDAIRSQMQVLRDTGLQIDGLVPEGFALGNLFENWQDLPPSLPRESSQDEDEDNISPIRDCSIALYIGHSRTLVNVFEQNRLLGTRSIMWGSNQISENIQKKYNISIFEAQKALETKGFILPSRNGATHDQAAFSETIAASFDELIRDIKLSLIEFRVHLNANVSNVHLMGPASHIRNLGAFLTQKLEIPVNRFKVLSNYGHVQFDASDFADTSCGVALGLALEGLRKPRNPSVNLLRGEFGQQADFFSHLWDKWGTSIQASLGLIFLFFVYASFKESSSQALADQTHELMKTQARNVAKLTSAKANEQGIKQYIRESSKKAQEIQALSSLASMNSALDVMKKVNDSIPARGAISVEIKKINIQETRVIVEGNTSTAQEFSKLEQSFKNIANQGQVRRVATSLPSKAGRTNFAFEFQVDRNVQRKSQ